MRQTGRVQEQASDDEAGLGQHRAVNNRRPIGEYESPPAKPVKIYSDCASGKPNRVTDFYSIVKRVSRRATL